MPQTKIFFLGIPFLFFVVCAWNLYSVILTRRLHRGHGEKAMAKVTRLKRTILFGRAPVFGRGKDPEKEISFRCDYIAELTYRPANAEEVTVESIIPARMKMKNGKRFSYLAEGDSLPVCYCKKNPRRHVVAMPEVKKRQGGIAAMLLWGISAALMTAILATMLLQL